MRKTLIVIPARAGSEGLANKNSLVYNNRPSLIEIACLTACSLESQLSADTILTTDYSEQAFSRCTFTYLRKRDPHLSSAKASIHDVIIDALDYATHISSSTYEYLLLLQPTSPMRDKMDIISAFKAFSYPSTDSIVSVSPVIQSPYEIISGCGTSWSHLIHWDGPFNRQEKTDSFFYINGDFYYSRTSAYRKNKTFLGPNTYMWPITCRYHIDIDDIQDFAAYQSLRKL